MKLNWPPKTCRISIKIRQVPHWSKSSQLMLEDLLLFDNIMLAILVYTIQIQMSIKNLVLHAAKLSAYVIGSGPLAERLIESLQNHMAFEKQMSTNVYQAFEDMGFKRRAVMKSLQVNK